jgi:hypothetical protein
VVDGDELLRRGGALLDRRFDTEKEWFAAASGTMMDLQTYKASLGQAVPEIDDPLSKLEARSLSWRRRP